MAVPVRHRVVLYPVRAFTQGLKLAKFLKIRDAAVAAALAGELPWLTAERCTVGRTPERSTEEERRVAELVMEYLSEHPQAMDTLEGVAEWWLMRQQVRVDVRLLARVLHGLTEKGLLEQIGTGEQARYALKRNRH